MGENYLMRKIDALISETKRTERELGSLIDDSMALFNHLKNIAVDKNKNIDEVFETVLSLERGYISALNDLSYQIGKLYKLKSLLISDDNELKTSSLLTFPIDINNLKATTLEEINESFRVEEDLKELEPLMEKFYEKGEAEGKTEEQLDEELDKFVDEFINKKYGVV